MKTKMEERVNNDVVIIDDETMLPEKQKTQLELSKLVFSICVETSESGAVVSAPTPPIVDKKPDIFQSGAVAVVSVPTPTIVDKEGEASQLVYAPRPIIVDKKSETSVVSTPTPTIAEKEIRPFNYEFEPMPDIYIDAAFRSICPNEVFMFIGHEYVVLNYDPCAAAKDHLVMGPRYIAKSCPLFGPLQNYGVDAAFSCHGTNQAFLFCVERYFKIEYDLRSKKCRELCKGLTKWLFPALEGTTFSYSVDAAFDSTEEGLAYLFSETHYALLNYIEGTVIATALIVDGFPCLANTMFERDIGAAFASHAPNEVYLFKDNNFARLYFDPGEINKSYIIEGPMEIVPTNWPSLQSLFPDDIGYDRIMTISKDAYETASQDCFRG